MRIVVGMTGATGAPIGVRFLEVLRDLGIDTHLIVSRWGRATIAQETSRTVAEVQKLATVSYHPDDQGADISSGSFHTDAMVIVPCSVKTLAGIRMGFGDTLIGRAADVTLKERRPLILAVRETPLSSIHLDNMLALSRSGATIFPPMPAFYNNPREIHDIVDHLVSRILDQLGVESPFAERWAGLASASSRRSAL
ncbi:UbiX family flavin prenyltransferase [Tsukamurella asaccharolytica]|uniref:Flavin prenyltransferase UbiX n=1 Tax=Tsukamurella asaccharolytica TaxID=2592067 RepID=A0A5C5REQ7_9ACTN|nr:UbiX family flavin prenyltransferase [Tsukamurella asaccharolytica]TWS21477.1 UbiX family flavin prenyltransferase [Tsukamurella asaccharolytica]